MTDQKALTVLTEEELSHYDGLVRSAPAMGHTSRDEHDTVAVRADHLAALIAAARLALTLQRRAEELEAILRNGNLDEAKLGDIAKLLGMRVCQAEDMGGYPACWSLATLQTKEEPRAYYCIKHKKNRHVWREEELEPMT